MDTCPWGRMRGEEAVESVREQLIEETKKEADTESQKIDASISSRVCSVLLDNLMVVIETKREEFGSIITDEILSLLKRKG